MIKLKNIKHLVCNSDWIAMWKSVWILDNYEIYNSLWNLMYHSIRDIIKDEIND